jgi:hypothetical protein
MEPPGIVLISPEVAAELPLMPRRPTSGRRWKGSLAMAVFPTAASWSIIAFGL